MVILQNCNLQNEAEKKYIPIIDNVLHHIIANLGNHNSKNYQDKNITFLSLKQIVKFYDLKNNTNITFPFWAVEDVNNGKDILMIIFQKIFLKPKPNPSTPFVVWDLKFTEIIITHICENHGFKKSLLIRIDFKEDKHIVQFLNE